MNTKRVLRLLRAEQLLVKPNPRLMATRTPTRRKPRPTQPNQGSLTSGLNLFLSQRETKS